MDDAPAGVIHVLHVDDEPEFSEMVAAFLERQSDAFHIDTTTTARDALDRLQAAEYDCVVSDYDMPETNGIEFLEAVRDDYPDLPFVLYTGKGSEEVASEAISAGVTDYLQKETGTSQYDVLANRIRNAVQQYRAQNDLAVSQRRLNLFVEQSPLGVIRWNENFELERMNEKATEILGYTEDDLRGRAWTAIVPESDRDAVDEVVSNLLTDEGGYHSINENVREDGERIVCEWHNRVVTDDGEVVAIYSQFQDVTDRREQDRRFEAIFNNTQTFTGLMDTDGTLLEVNDTILEFGGLDREDVIDRPIWETPWIAAFDDARATAKAAVEKARTGEQFRDEIRVRGADGTAVIDFSVRPIFDDDGAVTLLVPEGHDITARTERERELAETKAELETALTDIERQNRAFESLLDIVNDTSRSFDERMTDALELGVEVLDLDLGIISRIDPPDYTVEHVVTPEGRIEQGDVLEYDDTFCSLVFEADGPIAFRSPEDGDVQDHPCYRDMGLEAYLGEPLVVDGERYGTLNFSSATAREAAFSDGERAFIRTMSEWVTRELGRQRRDQDLERYETLLEEVRDGVYIIDSDGRYTYVNSYFAEKTGYERIELVGASPRKFLPDADVERFQAAIEDLLAGRRDTYETETQVRTKGGTTYPVEVKITVLTDDDGHLDRTVGVVRDITDRKAQERKLERLHEATRDMMAATSVEAAVTTASTTAEEVLGLPMNGIQLHDAETDVLVPVAWTDTGEQAMDGPPPEIPVDGSLAGRAFRTGEPASYADVRDADEALNMESAFRSELVLPLGEHGVLLAGSTTPDDFDASDAALAQVLAANLEATLDRVEREEALARQQSLLETQQEAVLDGILVTDEDRRIISYNDTFLDLWELPEAVLEDGDGERTVELVVEQLVDPEGFRESIEDLYATPERTIHDEIRLQDGRVFERYTTSLVGEAGDHYGRLWTFRDVTERKDRVRRMERERNRFEALFETIPAPTLHVRFDGDDPIIQHVNDAFEAVFGYASDEARGRLVDDLIVPTGRDEAAADINRSVRGDGKLQTEVVRTTVSGERPFLFTAQTMELGSGDGTRVEGVATYVDLSDQKRREEELARQNERLDEFASVLSHDLRNPLSVASGRVDLAREAHESDHLDAAARSLDRMEALIDDMLTLARDGDRVSDLESVDLAGLADTCWGNVETAEASLVVDTELTIRADRSRLKQVLENLFRNAVEHGGETVTITAGPLDDGGGFYVADDGPGVTPDDQDAVFDPGFSTSDAGTGFGLSIVRGIAEAHGWNVRLAEGDDGGARFEFTGVTPA